MHILFSQQAQSLVILRAHIKQSNIYAHSKHTHVLKFWGEKTSRKKNFFKANKLKDNCSFRGINVYFNIYLCSMAHMFFFSFGHFTLNTRMTKQYSLHLADWKRKMAFVPLLFVTLFFFRDNINILWIVHTTYVW